MVIYATLIFGFDLPGALVGAVIGAVIGGIVGLIVWGGGRLRRWLSGRIRADRPPPLSAAAPEIDEPAAALPEIRDRHGGQAIASLVLGCVGMLAWCLPIAGLPLTLIGLVLGIRGLRSRYRGLAIAGVTLSALGLILSLANAILGAYLASIGQHPLAR